MSLHGTLSTLGVAELLEFLAQRESSGQVDVTTTTGIASYLFNSGKVSLAEFDFDRGVGEDAAEGTYYAIADGVGHFSFEPQDVDGAPEGETVDAVLGKAALIAERWEQVEKSVPSTLHLVVRNSQLDTSVTIKPEWWKVLDAVGEGATSPQLSEALNVGLLEGSTVIADMVDVGLLSITEPTTPAGSEELASTGEVAAETAEEAPVNFGEPVAQDDFTGVAAETPEEPFGSVTATDFGSAAPEATDFGSTDFGSADFGSTDFASSDFGSADHGAPSYVAETPTDEISAGSEFDSNDDVVPETLEAASFDSSTSEDLFSSNIADTAEPPTAFVPESPLTESPVEEAVADEMSVAAPETVEQAPPAEETAPYDAFTDQEEDDDGWSTNPFLNAPPIIEKPVPESVLAEVGQPVQPTPVNDPAEQGGEFSFDAASFDDAPDSSFERIADEPVEATPNTFDSLQNSFDPAPEATGISDASGIYGLDADFHEPLNPEPASTGVANEVLSDLSYLNDGLDEQATGQADATLRPFGSPEPQVAPPAQASPVTETAIPSAPAPENADPFGALSDLVVDDDETEDKERGSVLKFLRRD